jgi:hypothetical protein
MFSLCEMLRTDPDFWNNWIFKIPLGLTGVEWDDK